MDWAWSRREKILFFPDEHLGRNVANKMGFPKDEMIVWDPFKADGGNTAEAIRKARLILWKGHCSVHQMFQPAMSIISESSILTFKSLCIQNVMKMW